MKKEYIAPEIMVQNVDCDIITFSETEASEVWWGPDINIKSENATPVQE